MIIPHHRHKKNPFRDIRGGLACGISRYGAIFGPSERFLAFCRHASASPAMRKRDALRCAFAGILLLPVVARGAGGVLGANLSTREAGVVLLAAWATATVNLTPFP